ncbi:hypothetical protein GUITHDRAFT_156740, partial [Guillardia theta CCMP2712]
MGNNAGKTVKSAVGKAQTVVEGGIHGLSACMSKDTGDISDIKKETPVTIGFHGPDIHFDDLRVSGSGVALASESISQDKAYFEVKIAKAEGRWGVGVCKQSVHSSDELNVEGEGWCLSSVQLEYGEGDVIGVTYDQSIFPTALRFYHNGEVLEELTITSIRGEVFPAVHVTDGAVVDCEFDGENGFAYPPPAGFTGVVSMRSV